MRKKIVASAALVAFALVALPLLAAAEEASVRVFVLKYKRVEEAALLIRPHLSDAASVTLAQRLNAMTVTDREENLKTIAKILAEFDAPPRGFTFAVKLVRARADVAAGSIAQEIGGLGAKLKSMFQFNDYTLIDSAVILGTEGKPVSLPAGRRVRADVLDRTRRRRGRAAALADRALAAEEERAGTDGARARSTARPLPVALNQTLVLGASRDEASKNALILILLVQETARPGVPGGKTVEKARTR